MHTKAQDTKVIIILLAAANLFLQSLNAQGSMSLKPSGTIGQISGTVRDDVGMPVPGAMVMIGRTFPISGIAAPRSYSTVTDPQGRYVVTNLPPASYKVCPSAPGMTLLDPCLWSAKHPLTNVAGGQSVTVNVVLEKGVYLNVRLDDPGAKVAAAEAKTIGAKVFDLSIRGTHGTPLSLEEAARDQNGRNYWIAVPKGVDIPLQFNPGNLNVQRPDGSTVLPSDAPQTVRGADNSAVPVQVGATPSPGAPPMSCFS